MNEQFTPRSPRNYVRGGIASLAISGCAVGVELNHDSDYGWPVAIGAAYVGFVCLNRAFKIFKSNLRMQAEAEGARLMAEYDQGENK